MVGYQWKDGPIQIGMKQCCDRMEGANRLRKNYVGRLEYLGSNGVAQQQNGHAGCSKTNPFIPTRPRRAETCLVPSKPQASQNRRRYRPHFVGPFAQSMDLG